MQRQSNALSIAIREVARAIHLADPHDRCGGLERLRASINRALELWGRRVTELSRPDPGYFQAQRKLNQVLTDLLFCRDQVDANEVNDWSLAQALKHLTEAVEVFGAEVVPIAPEPSRIADDGDVQMQLGGTARDSDLVKVPMMSKWRDRTTGEVRQICSAELTEDGTDARVELWKGVGSGEPTLKTTWRQLISTHERVEKAVA